MFERDDVRIVNLPRSHTTGGDPDGPSDLGAPPRRPKSKMVPPALAELARASLRAGVNRQRPW